MIKEMLIAGAGGFAGTCARYLTGRLTSIFWVGSFPMGTFSVNIAGCFLIGLFLGMMEKLGLSNPRCSLLLITGFCGGFTTFSAFANELYQMANRGQWSMLALYLALSVVLGIAMVLAGHWLWIRQPLFRS